MQECAAEENEGASKMGKKIVVGMSGGVDSSVAAYLLKNEGYEVIGVSMQMWCPKEDSGVADGTKDAKKVAEQLGIAFQTLDFREEFRHAVMDYFAGEYLLGRTPNPCIACNRYIKWEALLTRAKALGAEGIATGHYAKIVSLENGRYAVSRAVSSAKDQTYALYRLTQEQLAHTRMPLGEYEKESIREIAKEIGLPVAEKKDSQEICFIPDHDYVSFIKEYTGAECNPGAFISTSGEVMGRHEGIINYTVGQRKGLGAFGRPVFVKEIRPKSNEVVLGSGDEVFQSELVCDGLNCMAVGCFNEGDEAVAKIRYSHKGASCILHPMGEDKLRVEFIEPQRAITPGQAVVFYRGDVVLGGGTICSGLC